MPEFVKNDVQTVLLGESLLFDDSIPCRSGYIIHDNGSGVFVLRGISTRCFARYVVHFSGNIAIPADGTASEPIAVAFAVNGETKATSRAVVTPTAVDDYFNVSANAIVDVPRGAVFTLSVRSVSGVTVGATGTPAPAINVENANLTIDKTA